MGNLTEGFSRVDKKAKAKWRVSRLIGLILLALVMLPFAVGNSSPLAWGLYGLVLFLQLLNMIIYPIIEYIQWSYLIDEDRIEIKKGIIWRRHTIIPISRIQHVSAGSGPLQRMFKLATVSIYTAGGIHNIHELSNTVAEEICGKLQNVVNSKVAQQLAAAQAAKAGPGQPVPADGAAEQAVPDGGDANC